MHAAQHNKESNSDNNSSNIGSGPISGDKILCVCVQLRSFASFQPGAGKRERERAAAIAAEALNNWLEVPSSSYSVCCVGLLLLLLPQKACYYILLLLLLRGQPYEFVAWRRTHAHLMGEEPRRRFLRAETRGHKRTHHTCKGNNNHLNNSSNDDDDDRKNNENPAG